MTGTLGIDISNARCHSHMKASFIPCDLENSLTEARDELKVLKAVAAPDEKAVALVKQRIAEINSGVVRIGGDAAIAVAALADYVAKEAIRYAMAQTRENNRKMVDISALHAGKPETMNSWPLICDLPAITEYSAESEAEIRRLTAEDNKRMKAQRETKEIIPVKIKTDVQVVGPGTTFNTYVDHATKTVKNNDAYSALRVTRRVREVISNLVAQLVARLSCVAKVHILELLNVRTLTADHLITIVKTIFVQKLGTDIDPGMICILDFMRDTVKLYHAHLKTEKDRKWQELDQTKKDAITQKLKFAAKDKMVLAAATAKKKAFAQATLAKKLADEVSGM